MPNSQLSAMKLNGIFTSQSRLSVAEDYRSSRGYLSLPGLSIFSRLCVASKSITMRRLVALKATENCERINSSATDNREKIDSPTTDNREKIDSP